MSTECKFASAAEARKANWFSRRHRDGEAHRAASKTRQERKTAQFQATQERVAKQDAVAAARKAA
jgi:hypothetical protein